MLAFVPGQRCVLVRRVATGSSKSDNGGASAVTYAFTALHLSCYVKVNSREAVYDDPPEAVGS